MLKYNKKILYAKHINQLLPTMSIHTDDDILHAAIIIVLMNVHDDDYV